MKMHSYCNVNGTMQWVSQARDKLLAGLREATSRVGGWEAAIVAAKSHRAELDAAHHTDDGSTPSTPAIGTPAIPEGVGAQRSYIDAGDANALRRRLNNAEQEGTIQEVKEVKAATARALEQSPSSDDGGQEKEKDRKRKSDAAYALVDHPDQQIAVMAKDYVELDGELVSTGPEYVRWPENVTLKNFAMYMLIPSLVYELEYPRTEKWVFFSDPDSHRRPLLFELTFRAFIKLESDHSTCSKRPQRRLGPSLYCTPSQKRSFYR